MSGEIGNKALLRERAERLQMLDSKVYPGRLATDIVQPVQEVDPQYLGPALGDITLNWGFDSESGSGALELEVVPFSATLNRRVLAIDAQFSLPSDPTPSTAFFRLLYSDGAAFPTPATNYTAIAWYDDLFTSQNGTAVLLNWALNGWGPAATAGRGTPIIINQNSAWEGLVPAGADVRAQFGPNSGLFDANTQVIIRSLYKTWPLGTLEP